MMYRSSYVNAFTMPTADDASASSAIAGCGQLSASDLLIENRLNRGDVPEGGDAVAPADLLALRRRCGRSS